MSKATTKDTGSSRIQALGGALSGLGWGGLSAQAIMGAIPFTIMVYTLIFASATERGAASALPFVHYFSIIDLLLLIFIVLWFFRYTRIGKRIRSQPDRFSIRGIRRAIWIGIAATTLAILFSMLVLLFEVGNMLFFFLSAPQAGMPTFQTSADGLASWVSAVDIMSLLSLVLTLGGEVAALIFGLLLLLQALKIDVGET